MITRLEVRPTDIQVIKGITYYNAWRQYQKILKTLGKEKKQPLLFDELALHWKCSKESLVRHLEKYGVKS